MHIELKKICLAVLVSAALLFAACGNPAGGEAAGKSEGSADKPQGAKTITLNQPVYAGEAPNGKPEFEVSWSAFPDVTSYELAIYAEGEDAYGRGPFAVRKTRGAYEGSTELVIVFLQGVHTDSVRYRMKVRPVIGVDAWADPADYVWSNLWEVEFTDGEYSVRETDADFDAEIAAKEAEEKRDETPSPTPPAEKIEPLPHSYPEPLLLYLAREQGRDEAIDADGIASFGITQMLGEAGPAPQQIFTNEETVDQFREAVEEMEVTGKRDDMIVLDGGGTSYAAMDADGGMLFGFTLAEGALERGDGHYAIRGTEGLPAGMSAQDWSDYWSEEEERENAYMESVEPEGMPLLDAASYMTHRMLELGADAVSSVDVYIDWNQEVERFRTTDPDEIRAIIDALSGVTVAGETSDAEGQMWHISFSYEDSEQRFPASGTYLEFEGKCVEIGDAHYELEGMDAFYRAVDAEIFGYLGDYADAPKVDPVY